MHKLDRGCGNARYEMVGDGTVVASLRRPLVPANAGALSTALLEVAADRGGVRRAGIVALHTGRSATDRPAALQLCAA